MMMNKEAGKKEETILKQKLSLDQLEQVGGGWHSILSPSDDKEKTSCGSGKSGKQ